MGEIIQMNDDLPIITLQLVSNCRYCTMISKNPDAKTPIYCIKYSGSVQPICVNINTCMSCGEYKNAQNLED